MTKPSPLDDPEYADFAWSRYWRLLRLMFAVTLVMTVTILGIFYWHHGMISIHFYIATGLAVIASTMLTAGLMGLVFLSNGTGHDESIEDLSNDGEWDE